MEAFFKTIDKKLGLLATTGVKASPKMDWKFIEKEPKLVYGTWRDPFVVINKPTGWAMYSEHEDEASIYSFIMRELAKIKIKRMPKFIDRLDNYSNGLVVVSMKANVEKRLKKSMAEKKWKKSFRVVVENDPKKLHSNSALQGSLYSMNGSMVKSGYLASWLKGCPPIISRPLVNSLIINQFPPLLSPLKSIKEIVENQEQGEQLQREPKVEQREHGTNEIHANSMESGLSLSQNHALVKIDPTMPTVDIVPLIEVAHASEKLRKVSGLKNSMMKELSSTRFKSKLSMISFNLQKSNAKYSLYDIRTIEGKPSYIRMLFHAAGYSVYGEPFYKSEEMELRGYFAFQGYKISFPDPVKKGATVTVSLDIPDHPIWSLWE